jgi:hypothetical protein
LRAIRKAHAATMTSRTIPIDVPYGAMSLAIPIEKGRTSKFKVEIRQMLFPISTQSSRLFNVAKNHCSRINMSKELFRTQAASSAEVDRVARSVARPPYRPTQSPGGARRPSEVGDAFLSPLTKGERIKVRGFTILKANHLLTLILSSASGGEESPAVSRLVRARRLKALNSVIHAFCFIFSTALTFASGRPALSLHPENPHYFLFRGKPAVLITSGEHYGAVLNLDFNYAAYLDELHDKGLNLTRTFSGAYVEPAGAFNIAKNTLAPAPSRFICPWARSETPGYPNGGNKFDLTRWDEAYFKRLRGFVGFAARRGVVVEMNLFCPFYEEAQWKLSPQNAANNVNGIGTVARTNVYTLDKNGGLLAVHEAMVRKIVRELKDFDNVYYEICNEPYFGGVTMDWQHHIADVIADTGRTFARPHLISQNIANGTAQVVHPHPAVSIFNFHYGMPPDSMTLNYGLNKVIGNNETGFRSTNDLPYRVEAWNFIMAGGGLFNNLDYSFTVGHERGTFVYPPSQPGGGNAAFRTQMRILGEFIHGFDFVKMKPENSVIQGGVPEGVGARVLGQAGKAYAIYLGPGKLGKTSADADSISAISRQANLVFELPAAAYRFEWLNTKTGRVEKQESVKHRGGPVTLASPRYVEDIALRIRRKGR